MSSTSTSTRRVVVTGGAGFIGANLVRALLRQPAVQWVRVIDDLSTGRRQNLAGIDVELVEGSILDAATLDEVLEGATSVVHLAARPSVPFSMQDPETSWRVNADGTVEVLEAIRRTGAPIHVVVASSSSVYGANPTLPKAEDLAPAPRSPYAAAKLAAETTALAWSAAYAIDVLAVRFFNVFGPLQPAGHAYAAVVPAFVDAALAGRPLPVHGDGLQTRDFTFVGSVAELLTGAVVDRVAHPGPVNLAFGTRVNLLQLVEELGQVVGADLTVEHLPSRPGDVRDSQADTERLRSLFPHARPTPLRDGLDATVQWFEAEAERSTPDRVESRP